MDIKILVIISIASVSLMHGSTQTAQADMGLIKEVERLRNSLPSDDPSRNEIALRLADLYFYEASDSQKNADLNPAGAQFAKFLKLARQHRLKALTFYNEAAKGRTGAMAVKILFQQARLYMALQRKKDALPVWKKLSQQRIQPKIRTEALLRMAEHYEAQTTRAAMKKADQYFRLSLAECNQGDLCSYVQYRHAWLLRNMDNLSEAIEKMQLALWDSKGGVREESLRDLIVFLADEGGDGMRALKIIEGLNAKLNRPQMIKNLSDGFYSAGNKLAGTRILEIVNARKPSLTAQIRLLEEYYGLREWDKIRSLVSDMQSAANPQKIAGLDELERKEAEKIMRRLTIQLDGERKSAKEQSDEFQAVAMLYLSYFPKSDANPRMMESWLAAETDETIRMAQIQAWLNSKAFVLSTKQQIHFHEVRASASQKNKDHATLLTEMKALVGLYTDKSKKREAEYLIARAQYDLKQIDAALVSFRRMSTIQVGSKPDKWAIMSQNLVLDILNERKDYKGLMQASDAWLNNKTLSKLTSVKAELSDMKKVRTEAQFQYAVSLGETPAALTEFKQFCLAKKFLPKSCENAKTLSVKLKDQEVLLTILEETNSKEELINEYEASGEFVKAVKLKEAKQPLRKNKWTVDEALKFALLYELGNDIKNRDRWLKAIAKRFEKKDFKKQPKGQEDLIFLTLDQAGMIGPSSLKIKWDGERTKRLAHRLESEGKGNKRTKKILIDSKESLGPVWASYVLAGLSKKYDAQAKVKFYGRGSRRKFQRRVKRLKALEDYANIYLQGAGRETRLKILFSLVTAYKTFHQQILETPIPEGMEEEALVQIKKSLDEMASPFSVISKKFEELAQSEISKVKDPAIQKQYQTAFAGQGNLDQIKISQAKAKPAEVNALDQTQLQSLMQKLRKEPENTKVLQGLQSVYKSAGQNRLAAYFTGRIQQLKEGK